MITIPVDFKIDNNAEILVVLLQGTVLRTDPEVSSLQYVRKAIREHMNDRVAILCPQLPTHIFSFADPNQVVQELLKMMDQVWAGCAPYQRIILIGYSIGGLLARKLYICACGETKDAPFEKPFQAAAPRAWAKAVDRIILLAGMNRGWRISHNLPLRQDILLRVGAFIGDLCRAVHKDPLLFHLRRGAPFITQLRLQWLAMRHQPVNQPGHALIIQLLGTIDDLVSPEDNLDLVTGKDFRYFDVPNSSHKNILAMDNTCEGKRRKEVFVNALLQSDTTLHCQQVLPVDRNLAPELERKNVTDVVFVMHGIRDPGFWTHKIARKVVALGKQNGQKFETETSSYGYFPILPFLLPWVRRAKVEWFMNEYIENRAIYPNAEFSFVGHSNGTYLLAKALEDYPVCRFKHVVFTGSIVRRGYEWKSLVDADRVKADRVKAVLNYVATADWVVACFPKMFQTLRFQDIGSGGHDGFEALKPEQQVMFVRGGHGAALQEKHWDDIAHFIVHGKLNSATQESKNHSLFVVVADLLSPVIWLALFAIVGWGGLKLWEGLPADEWVKTLVLVLYGRLIWTILMKF